MHKLFVLLFILCSISQSLLAQRSYYISQKGNDQNKGSIDQPFQNIQKLNQLTFRPGDSILFEGNVVFAGELILDNTDSASKDQPITIGSYGRGRSTILAGEGNGILISNLNGIIIKNINVSSSAITHSNGFGIKVFNDQPGNNTLEHVRIKNVEAKGFKWAGIFVGGVPSDLPGGKRISGSRYGFKDVVIDSCVAHDNMYFGIYMTASFLPTSVDYGNADITVRNCITYNNTGDSTYTDNHSGSGILIDDAENVLIEYCVSYHNGHLNAGKTGGPVGIWAHSANKVTIQYCESYNNKTNGVADGGGFDFDGGVTNSIIQYCYSHDNDGAGYLMWNYDQAPHELSGNTIRYSISVNDGRKFSYGAIHIGSGGLPIKNIKVYNNTIIMPASAHGKPRGIWTGGSAANEDLHFYNNLIITDGEADLFDIDSGQKNIVFAGNAYWCMGKPFRAKFNKIDYNSFSAWKKATKQEFLSGKEYGIFLDPKITLVKDSLTTNNPHQLYQLRSYTLQPQSPLKNKGINLRKVLVTLPDKDFWGQPLNKKRWDIGAYQVLE